MAYPRKIRTAARRLWVAGYSYEKVINLLKSKFPKENTPPRWKTINGWSNADDWEADRKLVDQKATEKRLEEAEEIATDLDREEHRDKTTIEAALQQIRHQLTQKTKDGTPIILTPLDITQLVSAIDKAIRRKRINRLGYDTITHKEVTGKIETHNESVVITADISAKVSSIGRSLAFGMSPDVVEQSANESS